MSTLVTLGPQLVHQLVQGGPKGTLYVCSKNSWFDMFLFEKWFVELLLPILKRKTGKKLIIGDNIANHIPLL
jgi:hypothetical protein